MMESPDLNWERFKKQIVALTVSCQYGLPLSELGSQYRDVADDEFELAEIMDRFSIRDEKSLIDHMSQKLILLTRKEGAEYLGIPWPPRAPRNFGRTEADRERRQKSQDLVDGITATASELCIFALPDEAQAQLQNHIRNQRPSTVSRIGGIVPGIRGNRISQLPNSSNNRPRSLTPVGSTPLVRSRQQSNGTNDRARRQSSSNAPRHIDIGSSTSGSLDNRTLGILKNSTKVIQPVVSSRIIDSAASGREIIHVVDSKDEDDVPLYNNLGGRIPRELRESLIISKDPLVDIDQSPTSSVEMPVTPLSDDDIRLAFEEPIASRSTHCAEQDFINFMESPNPYPDHTDDVRLGSCTDISSTVRETREDTVERDLSQGSVSPVNHGETVQSQSSGDEQPNQELSSGSHEDLEEKQKLLLNGIVIIEQAPLLDSSLPEALHWDGIFSILNILANKGSDWIRLETLIMLYPVLFDAELPAGWLSDSFLDDISCFVRFEYDEFGAVWCNLRQTQDEMEPKFSDLTPPNIHENLESAETHPESLNFGFAPLRKKDSINGSANIRNEIRQKVFAMVLDHFGIGLDSGQLIEAYWIKYGIDLREWAGGRSGLDLFRNELNDLFIVHQKSPIHAIIYPRLDVVEIPARTLQKWGLTDVYRSLRH